MSGTISAFETSGHRQSSRVCVACVDACACLMLPKNKRHQLDGGCHSIHCTVRGQRDMKAAL
jgi:hypothetical protein